MESRAGGREYRFPNNAMGLERLTVHFQDDDCLLRLCDKQGEHEIRAGRGTWRTGTMTLPLRHEVPVSSVPDAPLNVTASSTWRTGDTLVTEVCLY